MLFRISQHSDVFKTKNNVYSKHTTMDHNTVLTNNSSPIHINDTTKMPANNQAQISDTSTETSKHNQPISTNISPKAPNTHEWSNIHDNIFNKTQQNNIAEVCEN